MTGSMIPAPPDPYVVGGRGAAAPFVDREREIALLSDWAADHSGDPLLSVVGIGGVGKTALAWKWFADLSFRQTEFRGRLWWGFYTETGRDFLAHCYAYTHGTQLESASQIPSSELARRIVSRLRSERFLLVLDGFEGELVAHREIETARLFLVGSHVIRRIAHADLAYFLRSVASQLSGSKILITSRFALADLEDDAGRPVAGSQLLELGGFDEASAHKFLSRFAPAEMMNELVGLAKQTQHHPLLLRLLTDQVARDPATLHRLRAALESAGSTGLREAFESPLDPAGSARLQEAARTTLGETLKRVGPGGRTIIGLLADYSRPVSYSTLARGLVGTAEHIPRESDLDRELTRLQDLGLIAWDQNLNTYDLHPLVRSEFGKALLQYSSGLARDEEPA